MCAPRASFASQREFSLPSRDPLPVLDERELARAARTDACILFTGPVHVRTLALRIHSMSGWRWGPFLAVDCGAPEEALEHQLFGVLGSDMVPAGLTPALRLLQPGTMFLHEVGKLGPGMQARLRDLLGSAAGVGWPRSRRRIMASTSVPLDTRVADGTFDDSLFYRLNVLHFILPQPTPFT